MLCIAPVTIKNPRPIGTQYMDVPCGKCPACLTNRRNDWSLRLKIELENSSGAVFITLTYNDENIYRNEHGIESVSKKDLQDYFKRVRKNSGEKIRYYAVGEYGTKSNRPHYHILAFNMPIDKTHFYVDAWNNKGHVKIGTVTPASIHYVTKYHVNATDFPFNANPSFTTMSRRPGIGAQYVKKMTNYHKTNIEKAHYTDLGGQKRRLPRYLKDKLYNKKERLKIADRYQQMHSKIEEKKMKLHEKNNPCKNYYELKQEEKLEYVRRFKNKINDNDTF